MKLQSKQGLGGRLRSSGPWARYQRADVALVVLTAEYIKAQLFRRLRRAHKHNSHQPKMLLGVSRKWQFLIYCETAMRIVHETIRIKAWKYIALFLSSMLSRVIL